MLKNNLIFKSKKVCVYGLRKLGAKTYFYIGTTNENPEQRALRHLRQAKKGLHENKKLAAILLTSHFVVDILEVVNERNRWHREYFWLMKYKSEKHKLVNSRNPLKPRQSIEKEMKSVKSSRTNRKQ